MDLRAEDATSWGDFQQDVDEVVEDFITVAEATRPDARTAVMSRLYGLLICRFLALAGAGTSFLDWVSRVYLVLMLLGVNPPTIEEWLLLIGVHDAPDPPTVPPQDASRADESGAVPSCQQEIPQETQPYSRGDTTVNRSG